MKVFISLFFKDNKNKKKYYLNSLSKNIPYVI